ncbi:MAG: VOC family protein [Gemmataceae bacterium]|nr:VOC family protein [Gemmataceae bacterium]MCI0738862.1 VOC family protein [Gemmataceae bacterium]
MASSVAKKRAVTPKRRAAGRKATRTPKPRARMLIDEVTAILLISPNAKKLCEFYRATLGLPLEEEVHDGIPLHYGYSLGDVHFAIHSASGGWPGVPPQDARSPIITFSTSDLKSVVERLFARGVEVIGPADHGFGQVASFRDPDGNLVSVLEYGREYW